MGVPKFFRFISERYPCINELVKEYQIPEFDNLYLDLNGIIHNCSHDDTVSYAASEERIFRDIFFYVELMFRLIQPKKVFMMAVDGVAPRAKMNQQRGRRFRTAKDMETEEKKLIESGKPLPEGERFDSNCITPGTGFMSRLHEQFKFFIAHKVSTDRLWQKPKIVYSGHNVPGEGEHKIMDYIRYLRSRDDWTPNTRHCLHGLDADLVMLGLCTHEPHFSLLREEVSFRKKQKRPKNPEEIRYFLLHLSLLRDYLDCEFQALKTKLPFPYDLEKIIDDWVLIGFLVGNDFIPSLPNLHIGNNALHLLYQSYVDILPTLGGYMNEQGDLNLSRFERYLAALASQDLDNYRGVSMDLKYLEEKTGLKKSGAKSGKKSSGTTKNLELMQMIEDSEAMLGLEDESEESDEDATMAVEFCEHKIDYYKNKLAYEDVTEEVMIDQVEGYIRAIVWNLQYYYNGCQSWSWYFPHHYSPYLSDLKGFKDWSFDFPDDKPFMPFEQLLAVLPAASRRLLPKAFENLMTSPESPIIDFYPTEFETDLNGKRQEWEAVVLIPFIQEEALLKAMAPCLLDLTEEEQQRNSHGTLFIFEYSPTDNGEFKSPQYFPDLKHNFSVCSEVWSSELVVAKEKLVKGLYPGTGDALSYGFPSLKHVPFKARLREGKVRVFEQPSRSHNMTLFVESRLGGNATWTAIERSKGDELEVDPEPPVVDPDFLRLEARRLLGALVHVSWPSLTLGRVVALWSSSEKVALAHHQESNVEPLTKQDALSWKTAVQEMQMTHSTRLGIELGATDIVVYATVLEGTKHVFDDKSGYLDYSWAKKPTAFAHQTVVTKLAVDESMTGGRKLLSLEEIFPSGAVVFLLVAPHYGSKATVLSCDDGKVSVELPSTFDEPDFSAVEVANETGLSYFTGYQAAQRLGMSTHFFSRITGTIYIQSSHTEADKMNIGLNLKFNKTGQEVVGFTRKKADRQWLYSEKCTALVDSYMARFPELFQKLAVSPSLDVYFKGDVFPDGNGDEQTKLVAQWLSEQEHHSAEQRPFGSSLLAERTVRQLEDILRQRPSSPSQPTVITLQVKPQQLHIPKTQLKLIVPDPTTKTELMDRIVNVRESHTIPLGARGTVIGE